MYSTRKLRNLSPEGIRPFSSFKGSPAEEIVGVLVRFFTTEVIWYLESGACLEADFMNRIQTPLAEVIAMFSHPDMVPERRTVPLAKLLGSLKTQIEEMAWRHPGVMGSGGLRWRADVRDGKVNLLYGVDSMTLSQFEGILRGLATVRAIHQLLRLRDVPDSSLTYASHHMDDYDQSRMNAFMLRRYGIDRLTEQDDDRLFVLKAGSFQWKAGATF
jgi:hypothetical protein